MGTYASSLSAEQKTPKTAMILGKIKIEEVEEEKFVGFTFFWDSIQYMEIGEGPRSSFVFPTSRHLLSVKKTFNL